MNNICPSCQAVYSIAAKDIGRRIACIQCAIPLCVRESGLALEGETSPTENNTTAMKNQAQSTPVDPKKTEPEIKAIVQPETKKLKPFGKDRPIFIFGAGCLLVIYFLFSPLIDQAKVNRAKAALRSAELDKTMSQREKTKPENTPKSEDKWFKTKEQLQDEIVWMEINLAQNSYWNYYGMMLGFSCLVIASIELIASERSRNFRLLGMITLLTLLVLIFLVFLLAGGVITAWKAG